MVNLVQLSTLRHHRHRRLRFGFVLVPTLVFLLDPEAPETKPNRTQPAGTERKRNPTEPNRPELNPTRKTTRTVKTITGKIEDLRSLFIFGATVLPWGVPHDIRGVTGSETRTPTAPSATEPYRYTDRQAHCSAGNGAVNNNRIKSSKTLRAARALHSVARTPRTFGSPCYRIQVSRPGGTGSVETDSNTSPPLGLGTRQAHCLPGAER